MPAIEVDDPLIVFIEIPGVGHFPRREEPDIFAAFRGGRGP